MRIFFVNAGLWENGSLSEGQKELLKKLSGRIKDELESGTTSLISSNLIGPQETAKIIRFELDLETYVIVSLLGSGCINFEEIFALVKNNTSQNLIIVAQKNISREVPYDFIFKKTGYLMDQKLTLWMFEECECLMIDLNNFSPERSVVKLSV